MANKVDKNNIMQECTKARETYWNVKGDKKTSSRQVLEAAEEYISLLEKETFFLSTRLAEQEITHWPRIKNLPDTEKEPFRKWLTGQTCPLLTGVAMEEQDGFYPWDYERWQRHLKGEKTLWD